MPEISSDLGMVRVANEKWIQTARDCEPKLLHSIIKPAAIVEIEEGRTYPTVNKIGDPEQIPSYHLKKGDRLCLDFGDHQVGYVTLRLSSVGSPQDAPAFFRLKFGEISKELTERSEDYDGWISRGWIQEEFLHVDVLPAVIRLPRRYAFRYLEILVIDTSMKWQLVVEEVTCDAVSSAERENVTPYPTTDPELQKLDRVSIRTLQNCMQSVFEDGPKRDRRLWLGDLRLQALANYVTFQNNDLVKRCLYLFAGLTREDGKIGACLFIEPEYIVDDTFLFDYSLFFVAALYDYYQATGDLAALKELWPAAYRQIQLSKSSFDSNGLMVVGEGFWCFIDWKEGLDKQAAAQGVYIYCARRAQKIAEILGDKEKVGELEQEIEEKIQAANRFLWDSQLGLFVSGKARQISYASQVWMILAEAVDSKTGGLILQKIRELNPEKGMVSPYMNHHYVEALLLCGRKQEALEYMKYYWGGMLELGADTFWELYNPENPAESPYGSSIVNSYCHAWSCTPTYLLRKYFSKED